MTQEESKNDTRAILKLNEGQVKQVNFAIKDFSGQLGVLESALGALIIGQRFGWRVLFMAHSPATVKKYEKILGLSFKDVCEERTDDSGRSIGLKIADKLQSFWAVALGKKPVARKDCVDAAR